MSIILRAQSAQCASAFRVRGSLQPTRPLSVCTMEGRVSSGSGRRRSYRNVRATPYLRRQTLCNRRKRSRMAIKDNCRESIDPQQDATNGSALVVAATDEDTALCPSASPQPSSESPSISFTPPQSPSRPVSQPTLPQQVEIPICTPSLVTTLPSSCPASPDSLHSEQTFLDNDSDCDLEKMKSCTASSLSILGDQSH